MGAISSLAVRVPLGNQTEYLFAGHADNIVRVWDLERRQRILTCHVSPPPEFSLAEAPVHKWWVDDCVDPTGTLHLAALYNSSELWRYELALHTGGTVEPLGSIPLGQAPLVDLRLLKGEAWVLLGAPPSSGRQVLQEMGRGGREAELASKGLPAVKRELIAAAQASVLDAEARPGGSRAQQLDGWSSLTRSYLRCWQDHTRPLGLLLDPTSGALGLVRRNGASLFRSLDPVEELRLRAVLPDSPGHPGSLGLPPGAAEPSRGNLSAAIVSLGKNTRHQISPYMMAGVPAALLRRACGAEEIVAAFVHALTVGMGQVAQPGALSAERQRALQEHNRQHRLFSLKLSSALRDLPAAYGGWTRVLSAVRTLVESLEIPLAPTQEQAAPPRGGGQGRATGAGHAACSGVRQVALARLETAWDLLVLLSYMAQQSTQVGLDWKDSTQVKLQLLPRVAQLVASSLLVHWLAGTYAGPSPDDFGLQLSSLHIAEMNGSDQSDQPPPSSSSSAAQPKAAEKTLLELISGAVRTPAARLQPVGWASADPLHAALATAGWLRWGPQGGQLSFPRRAVHIALLLLEHSQYRALQISMQQQQQQRAADIGDVGDHHHHRQQEEQQEHEEGEEQRDAAARAFLLGFASLACAHLPPDEPQASPGDHVSTAVGYFFRAAAGVAREGQGGQLAVLAECSDASASPSPYALLYAFHVSRHKWRKAAQVMYRHASRLAAESAGVDALQEQVESLAVAINALELLPAGSAWLTPSLPAQPAPGAAGPHQPSPTKRLRLTGLVGDAPLLSAGVALADGASEGKPAAAQVGLPDLQRFYALASARLQLARYDSSQPLPGEHVSATQMVRLLSEAGLFSPALSMAALFFHGSALHKELERIFEAMARHCCALQLHRPDLLHLPPIFSGSSQKGPGTKRQDPRDARGATPGRLTEHNLMLRELASARSGALVSTSGGDRARPMPHGSTQLEDLPESGRDSMGAGEHVAASAAATWQQLRLHLEEYVAQHRRLREIVTRTILSVDPGLQLPHWLLALFKEGLPGGKGGAAAVPPDPAALLGLLLDFDLLPEAASVAVDLLRDWADQRSSELQKHKRLAGAWTPYTLLDRLQARLAHATAATAGSATWQQHLSAPPERLQALQSALAAALDSHLAQVKLDSEDFSQISATRVC
eukprot:jgi/Mesen1/6567/ME000336S05795